MAIIKYNAILTKAKISHIIYVMNNKLKKIGNYFNKGVKIGMLSAALAMGAVGCKANVDEPGYDYVEETPLETYYFARHRFASENTVNEVVDQDLDKKEKIAWSNKHFNEIKDYMLPKVEDFMAKVERENGGDNFLRTICRKNFTYSNGDYGYKGFSGKLDQDIQFNNHVYSEILGAIGAKFTTAIANQENRELVDDRDYDNFKAIYDILALRSYNDSLGDMQNNASYPFNGERSNIEAAVVNNKSSQDYTANPQDMRNVEDTLKKALQLVSTNTGVSLQTLTDAVNLSLLNASIWGARDYIADKTNIQLSINVANVMIPDSTVGQLTTQSYTHNMYSGYSSVILQDIKQQQQQQEQENSL